ncbi:MAG: 16S rRNA (cytosine(967)-C(5))-methyltransferase RsmB, partial [Clostridia bacterium]|nr:16S rRNA (cytosine(967)-C(5))-methyltransferase RsmB [Clostridia bacterium]
LGVTNITTTENDGSVLRNEWTGAFDFVLADVPCSGLGVISGKPDIKWRKQDFKSLCSLQLSILKNAMEYVKKGGFLVYSTCTVNKAENIDLVTKALSENGSFEIAGEPIQLFPNEEHDGFFICKMKRCK